MNFDRKLDLSILSSDLTVYDDTTPQQLLERIQNANIIITKEMEVSGEMIRQFPDSVKLICEAGTGYNNIDFDAAKEKKITVCNIPSYSSKRVAHTAIMMILNLSSTIQTQMKMLGNGNYDNFTHNLQVPHVEVKGKTLGVVGAGHIDKNVIKIAQALDIVKKWLAQGRELDKDYLAKEFGDIAWYLAEAATALDLSLEDILQANLDKLKKRYPQGFDKNNSIHRKIDDL